MENLKYKLTILDENLNEIGFDINKFGFDFTNLTNYNEISVKIEYKKHNINQSYNSLREISEDIENLLYKIENLGFEVYNYYDDEAFHYNKNKGIEYYDMCRR